MHQGSLQHTKASPYVFLSALELGEANIVIDSFTGNSSITEVYNYNSNQFL